jgi:SPP1 gp7 family putative phage head morphogenesis protein
VSVNLERIADQASRTLLRSSTSVARDMQGYIQESARRLEHRLRVGWPDTLPVESRIFREARARDLLDQARTSLDALRVGQPGHPLTADLRKTIIEGRTLAGEQDRDIMRAYARAAPNPARAAELMDIADSFTIVDFAAVEAQVRNAAARLARYADETIHDINNAVVDGLVSGSPWRSVAREIRETLYGDPGFRGGPPAGGFAFRAETIARTEMMSSLEDAREQHYQEAGITQGIWVATGDERVCDWCAARTGNIYEIADVVIPAHPRCRCTLMPFRQEWADEGLLDMDAVAEHQKGVREEWESARRAEDPDKEPRYPTGPSPFEKAEGMDARPAPLR